MARRYRSGPVFSEDEWWRFGIGVRVRRIEPARFLDRLGPTPSRAGELRLKPDFSGRPPIPIAARVLAPPCLRLFTSINGDNSTITDAAPYCQL
ncbi:MAG: hypothetical protein ACREDJ_11020, partial [Methylocella sp.]